MFFIIIYRYLLLHNYFIKNKHYIKETNITKNKLIVFRYNEFVLSEYVFQNKNIIFYN